MSNNCWECWDLHKGPQKKRIAKPPWAMERISTNPTAWKFSLDGGLALSPLQNTSCSRTRWCENGQFKEGKKSAMREISENICKNVQDSTERTLRSSKTVVSACPRKMQLALVHPNIRFSDMWTVNLQKVTHRQCWQLTQRALVKGPSYYLFSGPKPTFMAKPSHKLCSHFKKS